jgi:predicted phosphoribosyltransferase
MVARRMERPSRRTGGDYPSERAALHDRRRGVTEFCVARGRSVLEGGMFRDRRDAGHRLARALGKYRGQRPLVLAVPRGAVALGRVIADDLGGDLDLVFVRKLRAPGSDEIAAGAIDEDERVYIVENAADLGATDAYLEAEKSLQLDLVRRSRAAYGPARRRIDPRDRVAIVVDDGLATGLTMIAALRAARARGAAWIVCAVPVASPRGIARVRSWCDEIVALATPDDFYGVSVYYADFRQVDDGEVARLLEPPVKAAS